MNSQTKANILIVDDTPDNLRLLMGILSEQGYNARLASNGPRATSTSQAAPPDLILSDIRMPGMDGYEVCEKLKADDRTHDIPVLFISALNGTLDKVKAFSAGGVDYITKPFQPDEVIARVETHLSLRNLQKSLQQEVAKYKQSEEELRRLNQQLREANASKDRFFSIMAHDLRSPFSALRVLPEVIIENIEHYNKDNTIRMASKLRDAAENLYALFENLLTWSRVQRGMLEYRPQQVNVQRIVAGNVALLTPNAEQKQITLRNLIEEKVFAYADCPMVDTVVRNLLSNALGTGLGLILCREFVEQNGGRIWVESEVEKGTTFRFTLPKKSAE